MKLPTQTHGPVTLTNIDYAANLSQETLAFTAKISIVVDGEALSSSVENAGHGGSNNVLNHRTEAAIGTYAKTLPSIVSHSMTLEMDTDLFISELMSAALTAHDLKRALSRKTLIRKYDGKLYECKGKPTDQMRARIQKETGAVILNDLPFNEALAIYTGATA
jgi:hypothetical protein